MQPIVLMYLAYVALSVGLTIWVAHTLSKRHTQPQQERLRTSTSTRSSSFR